MSRSSDPHALIRARRKLVALRRAEHRLVQRFEDIDFELDVIRPEVEALEQDAAKGELPEISATEGVQ